MTGNSAEGNLPTNNDLYRWICLNEAPPESRQFLQGQISSCRAHWHELKSFSERANLLEPEFEGDVVKNFHQRFWELYLPKVFHAAGLPLSRGKEGQPDFYFEKDGQKIWMEAVACGEPQEQNAVPSQGNDFFSGCTSSYENQSMRALASVLDFKIKKFNAKYKMLIQKERAHYIIALNGWRALNGHPELPALSRMGLSTLPLPLIVRTLFGMGDQYLQIDPVHHHPTGSTFQQIKTTKSIQLGKNGAPIAHFLKLENRDIAGVLCSAAGIYQIRRDVMGQDLIFIQNPYAPSIFKIFMPLVRPMNAYGYKIPETPEPTRGE